MEVILQTVLSTIEIVVFQQGHLVSKKRSSSLQKSNNTVVYDLQNLLLERQMSFSNIHRIWIVNGPGYYTGIRIGLAIAKAFKDTSCVPLRLVTTFHCLRTGISSAISECSIFIPSSKKEGYLGNMEGNELLQVQAVSMEWVESAYQNQTFEKPLFVHTHIPELQAPQRCIEEYQSLPGVFTEVHHSKDIQPQYWKSIEDLFMKKNNQTK